MPTQLIIITIARGAGNQLAQSFLSVVPNLKAEVIIGPGGEFSVALTVMRGEVDCFTVQQSASQNT